QFISRFYKREFSCLEIDKLDLNLIPKDKMIMASVEASQLKLGKLEAIIKTNLKSFRQNLDLEQNKGISL
ncbi:hypothetical protein RCB55_001862, partial [Campylobacter coli]|nr:hypothetical protein [Campylobacter coli]